MITLIDFLDIFSRILAFSIIIGIERLIIWIIKSIYNALTNTKAIKIRLRKDTIWSLRQQYRISRSEVKELVGKIITDIVEQPEIIKNT